MPKRTPTLPFEIDARGKPPLGIPAADFLRDYWQKRPLLIRNAFPDFETPVMPEDLAGLACEESALSRIVIHDKATTTGPCWCRTSTSGTRTSAPCSATSISCRAGASTT